MSFNVYWGYFKLGVKNSIEFKWRLFSDISFGIIYFLFVYIIWKIIYSKVKVPLELSFNELVLYFLISTLILTVVDFNLVRQRITSLIRDGNFVIYLIRPIRVIPCLVVKFIGENIIKIVASVVALIIASKILDMSIQNKPIFLFYMLLVFLFVLTVRIFFGILAFWVTETWGIGQGYSVVEMVLSGTLIPIFLFPTILIQIGKFLPFQYLTYSLNLIALNKISLGTIYLNFIILTLWLMLVLLITIYTYQKGIKKLESFGG